MKLYFDDRWLGEHGIGRFAFELQKRIKFSPLGLKGSPASPFDSLQLSWKVFGLDSHSLFFSPGYNPPLFCRMPYIICIHDLNHVDRTDNGGFMKWLYYNFLLKFLARKALAVLTVSEYSRKRIVDYMGITDSKVINVGNGVSEIFVPEGSKFNLELPYILCVSNRKTHKNETGLLKAFASSKLSSFAILVFTGKETHTIAQQARILGISRSIRFVGSVSEEDLAALYRGAQFLVFPSFYEGFGLPIIEAFACGTPVITSNVTSMPEIAGDAALQVNPDSVTEISQAMVRLFHSQELRRKLILKGLERSREFTWDAVAERVKKVLTLKN